MAPYTGVRWGNDRPVIRVQEQWSTLVSVDGLPDECIMEFANSEFDEKARKRFAEDLVEVLSKPVRDPEWTVTLGLETPDDQVTEVPIRMTEEKRRPVRE